MAYSEKIREEELKNKVGRDFFSAFDWSPILGDIDFSVALKSTKKRADDELEFFLWAESKKGTKEDILESFVQLILTIGKARWHTKRIPPKYLGAFDAEKIAFVPYHVVAEVFSQNDFNWNVTASNHGSKEFRQLATLVTKTLDAEKLQFRWADDKEEIEEFIKSNFKKGAIETEKIQIDKNTFSHVYLKWRRDVKPSLNIDWDAAKEEGLLDADFYLADLLSDNNSTIKDGLYILLQTDRYKYNIKRKKTGALSFDEVGFNDGQKAHKSFWARYVRPPKKEYWKDIVRRRDLLVPQDIREYEGSYFTPRQWVELSQAYIARELGENWQDEYYVWDCCAGTGNLLAGLTNIKNIYASTLSINDVCAMQELRKELIEKEEMRYLDHVFQFDFLNDEFFPNKSSDEKGNLPPRELQEILKDPEKQKKLVIYINPPYAEVSSVNGGKPGVNASRIHDKYMQELECGGRELFLQFLLRIYKEIPNCILAEFSTLKILTGPSSDVFRKTFRPKLCSMFICPAYTFDNVNGEFPTGFKIWNCGEEAEFKTIDAAIYELNDNAEPEQTGTRTFCAISKDDLINRWISNYNPNKKKKKDKTKPPKDSIGFLCGTNGNDFQHNDIVYILNRREQMANPRGIWMNSNNLIPCAIYFAIRRCVKHTWLNHNDQFLCPKKEKRKDSWMEDLEFQSNCLYFTLFHDKNNIQMAQGENRWIPFNERDVFKQEDLMVGKRFSSHFMSEFLNGEYQAGDIVDSEKLFYNGTSSVERFNKDAEAVFDAGKELWRYYHSFTTAKPDASLFDIRAFFQGTRIVEKTITKTDKETGEKHKIVKKTEELIDINENISGRNTSSAFKKYKELKDKLGQCLETLGERITPKVYEHGFLLK